jgi:hypothetical protein
VRKKKRILVLSQKQQTTTTTKKTKQNNGTHCKVLEAAQRLYRVKSALEATVVDEEFLKEKFVGQCPAFTSPPGFLLFYFLSAAVFFLLPPPWLMVNAKPCQGCS